MTIEPLRDWIPASALPHVWTIACLCCRFAPWCLFVPIGASDWIPWRTRLALCAIVVLGLVPMAEDYAIPGEAYSHTITPLFMECLLGLATMITSLVLLRGLSMIASVVAAQTSLGAAGQAESSADGTTGSFATLLHWLTLMLFFLVGGHRQIAVICLDSLERVPIGSFVLDRLWMQQVMDLMQSALVLGTKACLPLGLLLVLSNLVGGVASRVLPAIGSMAFGPGTNSLLALSVFAMSIGSMGWLFQDQLGPWLEQLYRITSR